MEIFYIFIAVGEWLLTLPTPTLLTADFAQLLWHIARASSSAKLPNTILTRSQLRMAEPGFKHMNLWLDILTGFELLFRKHKFAQPWKNLTDPLQLSLRSACTLRLSTVAHTCLISLDHPQISVSQ